MDEMVQTALTLSNTEKLNNKIFQQVALEKRIDPNTIRGTSINREFVPDVMKGDLCDRPERNARPFDNDDGQGGALSDGIILDSDKNDFGISGDSVFESSSCTTETKRSLLNRFFSLFGNGNEAGNICPASVDTNSTCTDSKWVENFFGWLIPEGEGAYY